jgi:ribokinase
VDKLFHEVDQDKLHLDCVYLTLEPQAEMVKYIIEEAARRHVFLFCDAAPHVRPLDLKLLPLIDIIAPNELEAKALTGITVQDRSSALQACQFLEAHGTSKCLITVGERGAYYYEAGLLTHIPAVQVQAIDEAGAGDAFRAAFVYELLRTKNTTAALEQGRLAGAHAVLHFGSYDSMPTREDLAVLTREAAL